ncbi:MAG TPA: CinA family nicotinamide mononucleotide deamidase-related protein [Anaerolineales bacterium]|nr:CinA family nicotinamide mononucleotide deamidase-related protein [Anaerolineales bacterium]
MPSAEIITIGTELLLGEIVDTNTSYIARKLRDSGIDLFRTTSVGDNVDRIAEVIQQSLERCEIVITTGGLGPTVDDPTREAVAEALGIGSEFRPELWEQIQARFARLGRAPTENNRRQAYIPQGALAFENPVGTAPIFVVEHQSKMIISLPGVPSEMEYLMTHTIIPFLQKQYNLRTVIKARVVHTVGAGESQIDDRIQDLERLTNPTVGLAAHSGQVDVRITVKADNDIVADQLIHPVETTLRSRLGDWIYGVDQETLEEVSLRSLTQNKWTLTVLEAGLGGYMVCRLAGAKGPFLAGHVLVGTPDADELHKLTQDFRQLHHADVGLGVAIIPVQNSVNVLSELITPHETQKLNRLYGGPPEYASYWAFNQSLDLIRRITHDN